jgi:hypothetical protein
MESLTFNVYILIVIWGLLSKVYNFDSVPDNTVRSKINLDCDKAPGIIYTMDNMQEGDNCRSL